MTITGVQNIVLEVLSNQDVVTLGELKLILLDKQAVKDNDFLEKMIQLACSDLEKSGILRKIDDKFFILQKPLASFPQQVEINGVLSVEIARVLNLAAAKLTGKQDQELCNSLNICDSDIETLVFIAKEVLKEDLTEEQFDEFHLPPNQ